VTAVVVTGLGVLSAFGRGPDALAAGVFPGTAAFGPVTRFDVSGRRVGRAAALPGSPVLAEELLDVIGAACAQAALDPREGATSPVLLAIHGDEQAAPLADAVGAGVAARFGLSGIERVYTCACVAASTAVADAAALIQAGRFERVVVAAGFLVNADTFAVFDAGRALARDGWARPFSRDRKGLLLGDAVVAVVVESADSARRRGVAGLARLAGWGRAGDAYHVCRPHPDGIGLARAIEGALGRAGIRPDAVDYVNANATGTSFSDAAEAAALGLVFGPGTGKVAVSSTKGSHGHALEASALLEFVVTVLAVQAGRLPVNAGFLGPDEDCDLDLVLDGPREVGAQYALSLNSAFGGANTALLVGAL
jgi:3-oxoacyl-[acyl-carrier-protein] synthase II